MSGDQNEGINGWDALAIEEKQDREGNKKTYWTKIGRVFVNRDGSINIYLSALPINAQIQLRPPYKKDEDRRQGGGQQRQQQQRQSTPPQQRPQQQQQRQAPAPRDQPPPIDDDQIPF